MAMVEVDYPTIPNMRFIEGAAAELTYPTSNVTLTYDGPLTDPTPMDTRPEVLPLLPEGTLIVCGLQQVIRGNDRQELTTRDSQSAAIEGTVRYSDYLEQRANGPGFWKGVCRRIASIRTLGRTSSE